MAKKAVKKKAKKKVAYNYGEYYDLDWEKFRQLIRTRMHESNTTETDVANALEWPLKLVRWGLHGSGRFSPTRLKQLIAYFELSDAEIPRITGERRRARGKRIFISYSHKDNEYLERLMVHLKPLQKKGLIDIWVDTRLLAGEKWKKEIEDALKVARVGILLISADFLASDFIVDDELPPLLQSAEEKGTLILPVILKPCRFTREVTLREFQAVNPPDEPLSFLDENGKELVYDTIAQRIEEAFPEDS